MIEQLVEKMYKAGKHIKKYLVLLILGLCILSDAIQGNHGMKVWAAGISAAATASSASKVKIVFDQAVKSVSADNFSVSDMVTVIDAKLGNDGKTVALTMEGAEYSTSYALTIKGLKLKDGGSVSEISMIFTTPSEAYDDAEPDHAGSDASGSGNFEIDEPVSVKTQKIVYKAEAVKNGRVVYGTKFSLHAKSSGDGVLSYKSSNSRVVSVNGKGVVTAKGYGPASITIKAAAGNGYRSASRKIKLTVIPKQVVVTKMEPQVKGAYFEWKPDKTVDGYQYSFSDSQQFTKEIKGNVQGNKNSIVLSDFGISKEIIYVQFRAYKKVGKKTYYGAWSNVWYVEFKAGR